MCTLALSGTGCRASLGTVGVRGPWKKAGAAGKSRIDSECRIGHGSAARSGVNL